MKNKTPILVNCLYCKKTFEKPKYQYYNSMQYRDGRHFCSGSCKFHYFRPVTMVKVKCNECHVEFEMDSGRYTTRHRINKGKHFCSNSCFHKNREGKTPFTYFLDKSKRRKGVSYNLDVSFLTELWDKQNGICPYTKIKMILPTSKRNFSKYCSLEKASLDRINPAKGYVKGNVEFVCQGINFAKNDYSKEEVRNFIEHIRSSSIS